MNLVIIRWLAAGLLFIITVLVGCLPVYFYQKWMRRKIAYKPDFRTVSGNESKLSANFYIQLVTQMGGGILFFTVLVHMIPDVRNHFEIYLKSNHSIFTDKSGPKSIEDLSLPYLEIAICFGFFAIYFTEVLMHSLLDRRHKRLELMDNKIEEMPNNRHNSNYNTIDNNNSIREDNDDESSAIMDNESHHTVNSLRDEEPVIIVIDHRSHSQSVCPNNIPKERLIVRLLHGLVIISTFSIHSIFDGISIGVRTEWSDIWTMFIAIASHKLMIALIISVELYEKCANFLLVVFLMSVFAIMSPIGIIVVIFMEQSLDTHSEGNPIVILLSAIASGTILYIVFFEILQKDRVSKLSNVIQFIAMTVGFGLMFIITYFLNDG